MWTKKSLEFSGMKVQMAFYIFEQEILCKQQLEIRRLKTLEPDKRSLLSNG